MDLEYCGVKKTSDEEGMDSSDIDSESEEDMQEKGSPVVCFFCDSISYSVRDSANHCISEHSFDIRSYIMKRVTSHYDLVKLVTYLRQQKPTTKDLETTSDMKLWSSDDYLRPVSPDDPWLWADEGLVVDDEEDIEPKYVNAENGIVTLSKDHFNELQDKKQRLEYLIKEEVKKIKSLRNLIEERGVTNIAYPAPRYFSYPDFDIHREMLSDLPLMMTYQKGIDPLVFKGKVVLNVRSGTGILAMLAASAGAKKVVGVDNSDIHDSAVEIIKENGLQSKVTLIKGKIEKLELHEKFDIIVSEWMGYFLLFERMLESVVIARNKFLKKGGLMIPSNCTIWLAGCCDPEGYQKRTSCHILGYRMEPLRRSALSEPAVEVVSPATIVTKPVLVHQINTLDPTLEPSSCCSFSTAFTLKCNKNCELTSICGWFDSEFHPTSAMSTSPFTATTHWAQTNFYFTRPIQVKAGSTLAGKITVAPESQRALQITIVLPSVDVDYSYLLH